jgi:ParB-like nuclease domain
VKGKFALGEGTAHVTALADARRAKTAGGAGMTATATVPRAADSAGITGVPAVLPLAALAAHPRNPRTGLGDLAEITESIRAHGVFEPLVVLTRGAYEAAAGATSS